MIKIAKIITGGQGGGDWSGNDYAKRHGIDTEINAFEGFKPLHRELPTDVRINYVCSEGNYSSNLRCRTKYNVDNSDFTIILIDKPIELTKGSKLTLNYCIKAEKPCMYINIYNNIGGYPRLRKTIGSLDEAKKIVKLQELLNKKPFIINIAGRKTLDTGDCVKFLERLFTDEELIDDI